MRQLERAREQRVYVGRRGTGEDGKPAAMAYRYVGKSEPGAFGHLCLLRKSEPGAFGHGPRAAMHGGSSMHMHMPGGVWRASRDRRA